MPPHRLRRPGISLPSPPHSPMKPKLLALFTVAALGVFAVWQFTRGGGGGPDEAGESETTVAAAAPTDSEQPDTADLSELDAPVVPAMPSRKAVDEGASLGDTDEPEESLPTWDEANTLMVEVTVVFPEGTPKDEACFALAVSGPMTRGRARRRSDRRGRYGPTGASA